MQSTLGNSLENPSADQPTASQTNASQTSAIAIARWEADGGALARPLSDAHPPLSEAERHVLHCLGAAVLLQWNDLPTVVQKGLFNRAVAAAEPGEIAQLKPQIARFLHDHKDDDHAAR